MVERTRRWRVTEQSSDLPNPMPASARHASSVHAGTENRLASSTPLGKRSAPIKRAFGNAGLGVKHPHPTVRILDHASLLSKLILKVSTTRSCLSAAC